MVFFLATFRNVFVVFGNGHIYICGVYFLFGSVAAFLLRPFNICGLLLSALPTPMAAKHLEKVLAYLRGIHI